ncbi:CPBP family intramembrane glutamic endopeptidase [Beijerinckia sp. L45]|uniref:CPBP family intramembrane glutamic endopeptidase n=1 Tax=Beijerinckia sp. L45 TaxID=1641855 RepID=UPI00131BE2CC|nr:CPBP family intramembrane glutamic endopeptidase [Beijerinckia sp. L45]
MTDLDIRADDFARAKPYGWVGLPISLMAIVGLGMTVSALVSGTAFGVEVALVGWHAAVVRASGLFQAMKGDPHAGEFVALCLSILIYLAIALMVVTFARFRGGARWRDLIAWHPWEARHRSRLFWAIVVGTFVYSLVANEALAYFYPASQEWVTLPTGAWSVALFFVVAVIAAPLTEELMFRGWLYTGLRAKLSIWPSLVLSSILFALAHWESTHLYALVVFPVGMALGFIRERAGSLKASMSFHAMYNGIALVMLCFGR